jgi:hypothetical protein
VFFVLCGYVCSCGGVDGGEFLKKI